VICPQLEGAALQPRAKVFYTLHGSEKFSVEGGIVYLGFGELLAEKSQRLPVLAYLLLQDCSDMGVGGVGSLGMDSSGVGWARGTAATRATLAASNAVSMSGVQGRALGLPESAAVIGRSVPAMPGRKR
jgi:hypothetical protein